ncbi:MAG: DMT family transporter [Oligoflexia bacterium]|nr:DMT family transporter [Oligoflexia bacterium]
MLKLSLLILATFIWGAGFVGTRWTLIDFGPVWSNGLRFVFAAIFGIFITLFLSTKRKIPLKELFYSRNALYCGATLWLALQLQTIGIGLTTLSKSGFLTTFYALFTPIICLVWFKQTFRKSFWALLGLSLIGVAFLCELEFSNINTGDLFILMSALFFSFHIILIDRFCSEVDSFVFNLQQIYIVALISIPFGFIFEGIPNISVLTSVKALQLGSSLWGFIILSIFSSIIAFSIQVYAQKGIKAHIVGMVFLMESVFSSFFGYLLFNEKLSPLMIFGCVLILIAVGLIPVVLRPKREKRSV